MMKPDLSVVIAYGTNMPFAKKLYNELLHMRNDFHYPILPTLIDSSENAYTESAGLTIMKAFTNANYAIILLSTKFIAIQPKDGKPLEWSVIDKEYINEMIDSGSIIAPTISQNVTFEFGLLSASGVKPFFFADSQIDAMFLPTDLKNAPFITPLIGKSDEDKLNIIISALHERIKLDLPYIRHYSDYKSKILNPIYDAKYSVDINNILNSKQKIEAERLGDNESKLLDIVFNHEYHDFKIDESTFGKRIQYLADRITFVIMPPLVKTRSQKI